MNCCCTKTLNFCTQNVCGEIDFDIVAIDPGVYVLVTEYLGVQITIAKTFAAGEQIVFPLSLLNENYEYTVNLFEPGGSQVVISKDSVDYDCFKFKTVINVAY